MKAGSSFLLANDDDQWSSDTYHDFPFQGNNAEVGDSIHEPLQLLSNLATASSSQPYQSPSTASSSQTYQSPYSRFASTSPQPLSDLGSGSHRYPATYISPFHHPAMPPPMVYPSVVPPYPLQSYGLPDSLQVPVYDDYSAAIYIMYNTFQYSC